MKLSNLIAESLGVFALCFIGMLSISALGDQSGGLLGIGVAHGLAIGIMITVLGPISGAHFNPAVTIGFWTIKKIEAGEAIAYIVAQFIGGLAAAFLVSVLVGSAAAVKGVPALGPTTQVWQAIGLEAIATFFLMLTILGTAVDPRAPKMGGLYIGLVIVICILAIGPLTGAALNPARHWGPAAMAGSLNNFAVWTVGPIVGSVCAALLYQNLFAPGAEASAEEPKKRPHKH